ncbi:MAG: hypothetical protein PX481_13080, partial [Microcystis sp. M53603_WE2]|uniref:CDP-alcohol phosphatidyltransferase family protein n=1 Tax=Microcystis sp. M53603_WE2 TaxID=3030678 RepID=UPI00338F59BF|nr:hypothetical protein [Microcystis sp. M53603_WE2]
MKFPHFPTPYTLHPTPYTLHPTPYTLHPTPYTPHPTPHFPTSLTKMNLPNSITLSRLLGLPLILYWLHQGTEIDRWLSLIIFLIAASTDWL